MHSKKKDKCYLCQQLRDSGQYCNHVHCPRQPKSANHMQAVGDSAVVKDDQPTPDDPARRLLLVQINPPYEG